MRGDRSARPERPPLDRAPRTTPMWRDDVARLGPIRVRRLRPEDATLRMQVVSVPIVVTREFRIRMRIAVWLTRLAARVMGMSFQVGDESERAE